ncbi:hypothetical protein E2C01_025155 [Portunus trituberculatus]|uniref:Uncharacterized protein n=1 Tax=Portunus trituberculatus TaxID=210409 RepID=A0A5B7EEP2_PORTR|nr:hypothetical protein [Portunus trituberculatus]
MEKISPNGATQALPLASGVMKVVSTLRSVSSTACWRRREAGEQLLAGRRLSRRNAERRSRLP